MPDYRRWYLPGATYFFTVVTHGRRRFLCEEVARTVLKVAMWECRQRWIFEIGPIVLLPDHLHVIWTLPAEDQDFSKRWAWIKREFTHVWLKDPTAAKRWQRRRAVWQPRFWEHMIRDERDFANCTDYIHYNPVKHGLAVTPREWPYSSFHRFVREGWYDAGWGNNPQPQLAAWERRTGE